MNNLKTFSDPGLKICPSGPSCCSRHVESRLGTWSVKHFQDGLFNKTTQMAAELDAKATQVDGKWFVYIDDVINDVKM